MADEDIRAICTADAIDSMSLHTQARVVYMKGSFNTQGDALPKVQFIERTTEQFDEKISTFPHDKTKERGQDSIFSVMKVFDEILLPKEGSQDPPPAPVTSTKMLMIQKKERSCWM